MANVLDYSLRVHEFELQSRYYIDIRTNTLGNITPTLLNLAIIK